MKNSKPFLPIVISAAAILLAGCATLPKSDSAALQGTWQGQVLQGEPAHRCSFVVAGNHFTFRDETDPNIWYKGTFTLKETVTPRQFIAVVSECTFPQYVGKTTMAIYQVENGTLKITGNEPGRPEAPATFDAPDAARVEVKKQ